MSHLNRMKADGFAPTLIVDVGAAHGDWTVSCQHIFPNVMFVLLEPLPHYQEELGQLARDPRVKYLPVAAGRRNERLPLLVPDDPAGSSFLSDQGGHFFKSSLEVEVVTLDDLELPEPPSLVKLDVQGYELEVLEGASRVLANTDVLIAECSLYPFQADIPLVHEVIDYIVARDFLLFDMGDEVRTETGKLAQIDLMFVRRSSDLAAYVRRANEPPSYWQGEGREG